MVNEAYFGDISFIGVFYGFFVTFVIDKVDAGDLSISVYLLLQMFTHDVGLNK
jgi:hypothetical protein